MSRLEFASIYAIMATIMVAFLMYMGRTNEEKPKYMRRQLYVILTMNVFYFTSFFSNNEAYLVANHCLVQAMELLTSYMFLVFAVKYTKSGIRDYKFAKVIIIAVSVLDVMMLVVNAFTQKLFSFTYTSDGYSICAVPNVNEIYVGHMVINTLLLILFVGIILEKLISVSVVYRFRYIILTVTFVMGMIICWAVRAAGIYSNFAIVLTMTLGECVIFDVFYRVPRYRESRMKEFAIKNITLPVFMFNDDDELDFINEPAKEIMDVSIGMSLEEFAADNNLRYILTPERRRTGKTKEFTLTLEHDRINYFVHGQELWDSKDNFVGTLLVYTDISKQEMLKDEATFHATRDALTGLWNREYFFEMVNRTLLDNPDEEFVMIVSDVAQFKMFNDILGTQMGDDLLLTISDYLKNREESLWIASRVAADRFGLFIPAAEFDEERFVKVCKSVIGDRKYGLSVHFYLGVYKITKNNLQAADIYDRAFMALESIKGSMDKEIAYYDEAIREKKIYEAINIDQLEKALREKQFIIYLQPQINVQNNSIIGCEALVRWINPERGLVPPIEFIPAFEDKGMIAQLDYYVWEMACKQLQEWKNQGYTDRTISVNISAKDFYLSNIERSLIDLVDKYDINPRNLKLEITETAFVLNVKEQMALVRRLQQYGFVVEIDDFGSGYSSLNSLKDICADVMKLDMKFFEKTEDVDRAVTIIESIISLAYKLRMPVIAEGVEDESQVLMLKEMGCNIIQGYYYAKPMPVEEFELFAKDYQFDDLHKMIRELKNKED